MDPPPEFDHRRRPSSSAEGAGGGQTSMQGHVAHMVWQAGSEQVKQAFTSYGRIDLFRPYFDVEPKLVRNRLFQSLLPRKASQIQIASDLYGPLMINLTLIGLLLWTMKSSGYVVKDGTLIGTATLTCFGYWLLASMAIYTMCYVFMCDMTLVQVMSTLGYALFGHCIVIFLSTLFHPTHDHLYFMLLVAAFAGTSCLRMAIIFSSKLRDAAHKLTMTASIAAVHCLFLVYLHFGFESIVGGSILFLGKLEEMSGGSASAYNELPSVGSISSVGGMVSMQSPTIVA